MQVKDFDYQLPPELIAQEPPAQRTASRMLVIDRRHRQKIIRPFPEIVEYIKSGDCLAINDTQVIPARLHGRRPGTGGKVEALLLEEITPSRWHAFLKPGRRLKAGDKVCFGNPPEAELTVIKRDSEGAFEVEFNCQDVLALLQQQGEIPLPPYIQRSPAEADRQRYQTVYSARPGAVAAPTAGLHFEQEILSAIEQKGATIVRLTLHTGPGTFQPVRSKCIEDHKMHEEYYHLTPPAAAAINQTRRIGGRVIGVGTTTVRVLETLADQEGKVRAGEGKTRLFLHPPMKPRAVDCLLTNFHLPRSTLMMLVSIFCGREELLESYQMAIRERMRFYSYGDCMLIV